MAWVSRSKRAEKTTFRGDLQAGDVPGLLGSIKRSTVTSYREVDNVTRVTKLQDAASVLGIDLRSDMNESERELLNELMRLDHQERAAHKSQASELVTKSVAKSEVVQALEELASSRIPTGQKRAILRGAVDKVYQDLNDAESGQFDQWHDMIPATPTLRSIARKSLGLSEDLTAEGVELVNRSLGRPVGKLTIREAARLR